MFDLNRDPFEHFNELFEAAKAKKVPEPNAMSLGTVDLNNQPSVRIVYLKDHSPEGFVFYGNYNSYKAAGIKHNHKVCLNFYWPELWQQIRIYGTAQKVSAEVSDKYHSTRQRLSQLGAWASQQSAHIPSYQWLQDRVDEFDKKFAGVPVPRPPHWGGWIVAPTQFEFWFGLNGRLHERYVYEKVSSQGQLNAAGDSVYEWKTFLKSP